MCAKQSVADQARVLWFIHLRCLKAMVCSSIVVWNGRHLGSKRTGPQTTTLRQGATTTWWQSMGKTRAHDQGMGV
eukprot:10522082-Prorocentrum_lima.AAC.1